MNFNERNPLSVSLLSAAVEQNSLDTLQQLIKKGRNVNVMDNRGWTPLHEACALGRLECLMLLLEAGARVEATTHQGETPFYIACKYNRMNIVEALLNCNDALIHTSDNESVTPLHVSCADHNLPLARLLVEKNVNVNAEDNSGLTPLQEAVMREDLAICKLLLENGANVESREYDGHLAFHFACVTGNGDILKLLIEHHSRKPQRQLHDVINSGNCYGFTPLMLAVQSRCVDTIDELLKLGANADAVNESNMLALHLAAHTGNLGILKSIFKTTSAEAISTYCTISKQTLQTRSENESTSQQRSLVSLVLDSESLECLQFILNCGLNCDVLNCPIIEPEVMPEFFEDMHNYAIFGPHRNIEVEVNIADLGNEYDICCHQPVVLHPLSFLLKQKMGDLGKDTVKYLQIMLKSGFTFDGRDFLENNLQVIHPFEAIMFSYQSNDRALKDVILECLRLMIDSGISVDYICNVNEKEPIPLLFVYACRLQLFEIIPYLLQHSNLVDLDDLLRWVVHKIFMRIDPAPHSIEKSLLEVYKYLSKYTPKSVRSFADEIRKPEYESRFNSVISFIDNDSISPSVPSLQIICRSVIRGTIKKNCSLCPYQLRIRLNSLELPSSLLALLNYSDMLESQDVT